MITWSLCMIVKNEEAVLERCLKSTGDLFDEIIIIDTGSADGTKRSAQKFTGHIYDYEWNDDFSAARNFAFSKATGDYIMWLDADDIIPPGSLHILRDLKSQPMKSDVYMLPYHTAFDETGTPLFYFYRERIIRNCKLCFWRGRVHEVIEPFGIVTKIDAPIEHRKLGHGDPGRNLRIYENMLRAGCRLSVRDMYYYGRELYYHKRCAEAEKIFEDFLKTKDGWIENKLDAAQLLAFCRYMQGDDEGALYALLQGLTLGVPRAELCCALGRHYFDREQFKTAAFWYKAALCTEKCTDGGFVSEDCYGFLPCIMLCQCFWKLGDIPAAYSYNELAGSYKPQSSYYLHNKDFFSCIAQDLIQDKE